ncbi:MAG: glycosyltransferase, partial [Actinobacteria bacterium]|nr:glycosyltransferase [Actinomycetota bacterium]
MAGLTISYLVPIYNEEAVLAGTATTIAARLEGHPGSQVILVENGSTDRSAELVEELGTALSGPNVEVIAAHSAKGYGNAMRRGIDLASGDLLVITAADLPFGFSDLDEALSHRPRPELMIGSKAHPRSLVEVSAKRKLMSLAFRLLRRVALGLNVGDSQGTILIDRVLAQRLRPHLASADFFFSTELIALATRLGVAPVELPVDYRNPRPGSTVRPLHDGLRMARA